METSKIILFFLELKNTQETDDRIIKSDLDISLRNSRLKITLSLLLQESTALFYDNDEIVLDLEIDRKTLRTAADITDSKGNYYLKEDNKNICYIYMKHLAETVNYSIDKISRA